MGERSRNSKSRQASSGFFCPSFRESRAFRPTAVPTPMAIIKKRMAYIKEGADGHFRQFVFRVHRFSFFGQTKKREIVEG